MTTDRSKVFSRRHLSRFLATLFYVIVAYVLVQYFKDIDWGKLSATDINWRVLGLALFSDLCIRFLHPGIWILILKEFGENIKDYWGLNLAYAKAWLGRYVPGKVAWIGGKIYFGAQQGVDVKVLTLGSFLESLIQLIAHFSLALFVMSFYTKGVLDQRIRMFALVSLAILLIFTYPPFFNRVTSLAYTMFKGKEIGARYALRFRTMYKIFSLLVLIGILNGIPAVLVCRSVVPSFDLTSNFFYVAGAGCFAGCMGILAVFAPSGLGVREGIFTIFLTVLFPREAILVILVVMRLSATIADLGFFLVSKGILHVSAHPRIEQ